MPSPTFSCSPNTAAPSCISCCALALSASFSVSIVDSSFVPLPIPGVTDIMLVLLAAQHQDAVLLIALATFGSALGGWFSWRVGQSGGMAFIEKRTPPRIYKRVSGWMESHAILAVAIPAILPPPMPLSPFVLAAGALHMSLRKFMIAFTASRAIRHTIAVLLGIRYGKAVLHLWFRFSDKYGTAILIVLWAFILISCGNRLLSTVEDEPHRARQQISRHCLV